MAHLLSREQEDLLKLLSDELQEQLSVNLSKSAAESSSDDFRRMSGILESFSSAADAMGMAGLFYASHILSENFSLIAENMTRVSESESVEESNVREDLTSLVDTWPVYFLEYVNQLLGLDHVEHELQESDIQGFVDYFSHPAWLNSLEQDQLDTLKKALLSKPEITADLSESSLPRVADLSLLSLALSDTINPDLFEGLMLELPNQISVFSYQIEQFNQSLSADYLANAQRIAHTIKGSANVVGISGIANLMHFTEDFMEEIARVLPEQEVKNHFPLAIKNLLTDIADTLAALLDLLISSSSSGEAELRVMQALLDAYHQLREEGITDWATQFPQIKPIAHSVEEDTPEKESAVVATSIANQIRVSEEVAQDLLLLAGQSATGTNRLITQVSELKLQLQHINLLHSKLTNLTDEFSQFIEIKDLFNNKNKLDDINGLDPLEMERYNELHSFFHQLQEFATDTKDAIVQTQQQLHELEELTVEQQLVNRSSQKYLLDMRLVPVSSFESRFQRCVRQASRLTAKQVKFNLIGGDTQVDSRILHEIMDPLMHLLRNAVDHGIETEAERINAGKKIEGEIDLEFSIQGRFLIIHVKDDGAGLYQEKILQKAQAMNLIPDTQLSHEMRDHFIKQLIFTAGFSTRDQVSQTSGRGIGLDVAVDRILALKGRISVESKPNQGCDFIISLPMVMIAEHCLLVSIGDHQVAVAGRAIKQLLHLNHGDIFNKERHLFYHFGDQDIEVIHMAQLVHLPNTEVVDVTDAHALLIVESAPEQILGVLVESVVASKEMVIKPLSTLTPSIRGVIGATILGNGDVASVIDIQQLVIDSQKSLTGIQDWAAYTTGAVTKLIRPIALVVDDSLSTRRSLTQFVGDLGMEVRTAKDGFEAISVLQDCTPSIILVDMEMPRMNGLELTAHVKANESTRHIPVIMITSRNTDKHRQLAQQAGVDIYLNKPYSEDELLNRIESSINR
jgi:chemotaxis protein histidine kinase CheA